MALSQERGFNTLSQFLMRLEREGELHRITAEVDPILEASEIAVRALREGRSKALLFENVKGSQFPLAMNVLASDRRIELALGTHPEELGESLVHFAEQILPPKPRSVWNAGKPIFPRLLAARVRKTSPEEPRNALDTHDLGLLPILQTWPEDAGKFITLPQVFTYDPKTGKRNWECIGCNYMVHPKRECTGKYKREGDFIIMKQKLRVCHSKLQLL